MISKISLQLELERQVLPELERQELGLPEPLVLVLVLVLELEQLGFLQPLEQLASVALEQLA